MQHVFLSALLLLSGASAQAAGVYHCDRFNPTNNYEVTVDTSRGTVQITGNKTPNLLTALPSVNDTDPRLLTFTAQADDGDALRVDFNADRLEATVSSIDVYGDSEEIGEGVCQVVQAI